MNQPNYVNGRILLREHGGVRRYAHEVTSHLEHAEIVMPRSANYPWSARLWEQTTLARTSADGVLLSMAHSGPVRHERHVLVIHDLLALRSPASVRRLYAGWLRGMLPVLAKRAAQIVVGSQLVADEVMAHFGIASSKIEVVYPGVSDVFASGRPPDARSQLGLDANQPTIAALLDPTPRKNSHRLATLLREMQFERPGVQVVVAGNNEPSAFARRLGAARVDRTGFVDIGAASDADLATMYQAADVFVSLTDGEGFGLPAVEAAVCGAAVVTTPVPSIVECAPTSGQIVGNAAEAKIAVLAMLDNPNRRYEMNEEAARVRGDLRWRRTAASLEAIMNNLSQT